MVTDMAWQDRAQQESDTTVVALHSGGRVGVLHHPKNAQGGSWKDAEPGAMGLSHHAAASGAHLIHGILREVELGQAGGVDEGHICPPAEEDEGAGSMGQWAQEHLDVGFLLGVGMGA